MRLFRTLAAAALLLSALGCHSAFIEATVQNHTAKPIELVEIDYPSASFGTQALQPGADFHYRFKVLGTGSTKLLWTDNAHAEHTSPAQSSTKATKAGSPSPSTPPAPPGASPSPTTASPARPTNHPTTCSPSRKPHQTLS